jgi:cytochrome oxidase Cu insertion factor (SCO1/SenC/PrrC family)
MTVRRVCIIGAVLASLAVAPVHAQPAPTRSASELMDVLMWNREPVGGPFRLVDHTGKPRTDADFHGKLVLLYFGFTYCPDLCPTDLASMGVLVETLGKAGESVQPLFVTLDPDRDTAERLASYVTFFHPRLIGLTGDEASIAGAASAYKVYYAKVPTEHSYTVDHSGYVYLLDRAGRYLGFFPPGTPPDRMADVVRPLLANSGSGSYE